MDLPIGYYLVKHYNYMRMQILYWNGNNFEGFKSDPLIHDEVESFQKIVKINGSELDF